MYVISWGACRALLCVVPYRGFLTPLYPNNIGSNSNTNTTKIVPAYRSARKNRSPNNKTKVKANTNAPIKKQKTMS